MRTSVKNAVSEHPELKQNHFRQSTQKDEQRKCYREEEGESRTKGHGIYGHGYCPNLMEGKLNY